MSPTRRSSLLLAGALVLSFAAASTAHAEELQVHRFADALGDVSNPYELAGADSIDLSRTSFELHRNKRDRLFLLSTFDVERVMPASRDGRFQSFTTNYYTEFHGTYQITSTTGAGSGAGPTVTGDGTVPCPAAKETFNRTKDVVRQRVPVSCFDENVGFLSSYTFFHKSPESSRGASDYGSGSDYMSLAAPRASN